MATMTYVPSRLGEGFFIDVPIPGSGDDDKALTYDHGTGEFVYVAFDAAGTAAAAVAAHVAAGNPHDQYELESANTAAAILAKVLTVDGAGSGLDADLLDGQSSTAFLLASGAHTGAVSSRQVFTNGITVPTLRPLLDANPSFLVQTASGGSNVFLVDTINGRVGVNVPSCGYGMDVNGTARINDWLYCGAGRGIWALDDFYIRRNLTVFVFGSADTYFGTNDTSGSMFFKTGDAVSGSLRIVVKNNGNTGIGTGTAATALLDLAASTTARASLRIRSGTAPTTPNAGDCWFDGTNLKFYDGSATRTITWT